MQFFNTGLEFSPPVHDQSEVRTSLRITSNLPPSIVRREKRSEHNVHSYGYARSRTDTLLRCRARGYAHLFGSAREPTSTLTLPSSERSWCGRLCVLHRLQWSLILEIYFPEFWCRSIWSPAPQEIISQTWVQQTTLCPGIQVAKLVLTTFRRPRV